MKTGWPPDLLQDDCRKLFRWFADRIDARWVLRQTLKGKHMKLYTARIAFDFVVVAEDQLSAFEVALNEMREAFSDLDRHDVDIDVSDGVHAYKWDDDCIPYGGDGNTRTGAYK